MFTFTSEPLKYMQNTFETHQTIVGVDALASVFGTGSDNVLMPTVIDKELEETANRVFKNETTGSVLDDALEQVKSDKVKSAEEVTPVVTETKSVVDEAGGKKVLEAALAEIVTADKEETTPEAIEKSGRPRIEKNVMVDYLKDMIEADTFGLPSNIEYDSTKQTLEDVLSKLSKEQLYEVLNSNRKAEIEEIRNQTPVEFFESLPGSLQYAAKAVADGAGEEDLQNIYKALLRVEEVKVLDPVNEDHQPLIIQTYLRSTGWKEEAIAEQIEDWKSTDKLTKKAMEFKPALDDMQKEQVQAQMKYVEQQKQQQQELAKFYTGNVYQTLEKNELAGIKLDKKFARELGNNMVTTVPGPYSGNPVNYLGYGLEMSQYTKPDYEAVMLAAWILNDKAAALEALSQSGANKQVEKDIKLIKINNGLGKVGGDQPQQTEVKKIKRINTDNVLKRTMA